MSREIKFRGMTLSGEWVYGLLAIKDNRYFISNKSGQPFAFEVIPETVGQYTGLKDKNGKEIYEGDIVNASWYDREEPRDDAFGYIIYNQGWCSFCIWNDEDKIMSELNGQGAYHWEIEVIGNIYENPELLESEESK